jgi:L-serine dehydratase
MDAALSTFDIFKVGIGPSSSHTMGPWTAARRFLTDARAGDWLDRVQSVQVHLYGSLAKTGHGHGTDIAVILGLTDADFATFDTRQVTPTVEAIGRTKSLPLAGTRPIPFDPAADVRFHRDQALPFHPNGLTFTATLDDGSERSATYYSVGGGFVVTESESSDDGSKPHPPLPFSTAAELVEHCRREGLTIPEVVRTNERAWRDDAAIDAGLQRIWSTLRDCAERGCRTPGVLPGGLGVVRRAPRLYEKLTQGRDCGTGNDWVESIGWGDFNFRQTLEWVSCLALAVNEENAAFGRVVTAPTNGAAGVIPAVLIYHVAFNRADARQIADFLLTAAAVGMIFKQGATISAAMGGCQAEIGVSSAMAAAGLCQVLGGSSERALMAAEIAMEHHLGLTCDPVGGLVQIPCIERNTMGAIKAITAGQLALDGDPASAKVPLDAVVRTMWATAQDMSTKYKETSEGGLAVQIPVSVIEC